MEQKEFEEILRNKDKYIVSENLYECPVCHKQFSIMGFGVHLKKQHINADNGIKNSGGYNGHYQEKEYADKISNAALINSEKKRGKQVNKEVTCSKCGKHFIISERENQSKEKYFCSSYCAHFRSYAPEQIEYIRQRAKNWMKKKLKEDPHYLDKLLQAALNRHIFTSKNEVLIRDFIINNHKEDEWTFGGMLKCGNYRIVRDLYSSKLKICFEYDGIWHFKDIHGQLEDKRNKDNALEKWCLENNWTLIRVSETWFQKHNKDVKEIENILYNSKVSIIKLGEEYKKV